MRRPVAVAAAAAVGLVVGLLIIHVWLPQRSGVIALTQVLEPFLVLGALTASPLALLGRSRMIVVLVVALLALTLPRYGPLVVSLPPEQPADDALRVATWNLLTGDESGDRALRGLTGHADLDLVGLEELQPAAARAVAGDATLAARFPHRVLVPEATVLGMGLLSRFPIVEHEAWADPPLIRAIVAPPDGDPLTVFVGHPLPARIHMLAGTLPYALDTGRRDEDLAFIASLIEAERARGAAVLVIGDYNVTEREPAYATLRGGLADAHLDAGIGPGSTWRPARLAWLPFGLLRIDYIFSSPELRPVSAHVDCREQSDHCLVAATLRDTRIDTPS